jgi:hypothetical protein
MSPPSQEPDLPDGLTDDDRRADDRRGSERRAHRLEEGRRGRDRRARRGWLAPVVAAFVLVSIVLGWRAATVAPRRAAERRAAEVEDQLAGLLGQLHPLGVAVPGLPLPAPGLPTGVLVELGPGDRELLQDAERFLSESLVGAPTAPGVLQAVAPLRLLLGDARGARRAWEELSVAGDADQRAASRLGLSAVAIGSATRFEGEDRAFALDHARWHLARSASGAGPEATYNAGIALLVGGDRAGASVIVDQLAGRSQELSERLAAGVDMARAAEQAAQAALEQQGPGSGNDAAAPSDR